MKIIRIERNALNIIIVIGENLQLRNDKVDCVVISTKEKAINHPKALKDDNPSVFVQQPESIMAANFFFFNVRCYYIKKYIIMNSILSPSLCCKKRNRERLQ